MEQLHDYYQHLYSALPPSTASTFLHTTLKMRSYFLSALDTLANTSPSLTTVALLLIILFLSLKLLDMLYRAVMFWVRLALRVLFWGTIIGVGLWLWTRGADGVGDDLSEVQRVWGVEYDRAREVWDGEGGDIVRGWFG
ncbi:hypothetical protein EJ06DRAFT_555699 [Trichodelitschia bisporula]|uniref:Nuclear pore assembly and biogenesis-domain-containing protein n=1 Tax=Trichodelitschia bisporula TaxID=703511 RepID=A0A6G1HZ03_9PEZI|nr:hypothetical protein EJ06DRAFT_555699 [Trichodelitschia bisporula]